MSSSMLSDFCSTGTISNDKLEWVKTYINDVDNAMANATSNIMCTSFCNCPASNATTGNWLNLYSEATLNANNRTNGTSTSTLTTLTLSATNATTFSTFWSCYTVLKNIGYKSVKGYDLS